MPAQNQRGSNFFLRATRSSIKVYDSWQHSITYSVAFANRLIASPLHGCPLSCINLNLRGRSVSTRGWNYARTLIMLQPVISAIWLSGDTLSGHRLQWFDSGTVAQFRDLNFRFVSTSCSNFYYSITKLKRDI